MSRITKKIISYISDMQKKAKQISFTKDLKKEVDIGATGTQRYRIKKGPNKGKVL